MSVCSGKRRRVHRWPEYNSSCGRPHNSPFIPLCCGYVHDSFSLLMNAVRVLLKKSSTGNKYIIIIIIIIIII
jgi:hypothetical protein